MMGVSGDFHGPRRVFGPRRIDDPAPPGAYGDLAEMRQAFAREPAVAPAPETCPPPETLWSAFHGELPPAEALQVVDHTAACPACAEDWRLAREVEYREQEAPNDEVVPVRDLVARFGSWRKWTAGTVAAASLAASLGALQWAQNEGNEIAVQLSLARGIEGGTTRGGEHATIRSRVPSGTVLPRSRCLLRWRSGLAEVSYDVEVNDEDLRTLAQAKGLKKPEILVPESH